MISIQGLEFAYAGREPVLTGLNFAVQPGALMVLAGANGSGKSTLLSLLAGLLSPTRGEIRVGDCVSPGDEAGLRTACGLLLQDADLQILGGTVAEDLDIGPAPGDQCAISAARAAGRRLGLDPLLDRPVQTLSGGQKRRLCLATTLARSPKVLLLDEPFSGLDYPGMREMREMLGENKAAGLTQIVAAHDLDPLADLADLAAVLHLGRMALFGKPEEILDQSAEFDVRPPCSWLAGRKIVPWEDR